ncbi:MAG: 3-hydroxyacyl-ACP dehydratase FabZ [Spirochaetales bacterium]|nr:3-hydroxyacyl-ACP dehydratase FabZ [Spirochaetales bacterium]
MSEVESLLPHRKPFLYVDRIESATGEEIIGYKKFTDEEYFFAGHFPEYPVVPGVILVETMAQCGGAGVAKLGALKDALFFLATVDKAKFRQQVRPNDEVKIVVKNIKISKIAIKQEGKIFVHDKVAAEAEWLCMVGSKDSLK